MSIINFKLSELKEILCDDSYFFEKISFESQPEPIKININIRGIKINNNELILNTLLIPSLKKSSKALIFLQHGGRKTSHDPKDVAIKFSRWSYGVLADYNIFIIEDPMYKIFPRCSTAWYYGDRSFSILQCIGKIVSQLCVNSQIANNDIIFIGSSAGAYASLYLADLINGSNCIAMNPQINLENWGKVANFFAKYTENDILNIHDVYHRNDLCYISKNKKSNFYIYVNLCSKVDNEQQLQLLVKELKIKNFPSKSGIFDFENFHFILSEIPIKGTHGTVFSASQLAFLTEKIFTNKFSSVSLDTIIDEVTDYFTLADNLKYYNFWLEVLQKINIGSFKIKSLDFNKLVLNNDFGLLQLQYSRLRTQIKVSFKSDVEPLHSSIEKTFANVERKEQTISTIFKLSEFNDKICSLLKIINAYSDYIKLCKISEKVFY